MPCGLMIHTMASVVAPAWLVNHFRDIRPREGRCGIELEQESQPIRNLLETIDSWWQVMADPEGNEFCVVADQGHPPPSHG